MGIPRVKPTKGARLAAVDPVDYEKNPPLFSLERVQPGEYCFSSMNADGKSFFGDAIFRRRALSWTEIKKAGRHGLGFEKIARGSIKAPIPVFIKEDVDHFLAFRFNGMKPMVGFRVRDIFYVLWFDHNYSLYDHG